MAVILPELLARTMPASSPVVYECMDGGAGSGTTPPPALIPARHQHTWRRGVISTPGVSTLIAIALGAARRNAPADGSSTVAYRFAANRVTSTYV